MAQVRPKVQFDNIQVGFSGAAEAGEQGDARFRASLHKAGFWTPVYVSITAGPDGIESGRIVVESTDSDDIQNHYIVPLPRGGLPPNEPFTFLTYTKPSSLHSEINVIIEADGKQFEKKQTYEALGPGDVLYLSVGSRLTGLRQALTPQNTESTNLSQTRFAYVDRDIQSLPDHWFGYSPVDLLVLTTGNRDFVSFLLNERENRKEALAEWVRRGGRLVISFAKNQDMVPELLKRLQIEVPLSFAGPANLPSLSGPRDWLSPATPPPFENRAGRGESKSPPVEFAKIVRKAEGELEVIIPSSQSDDSPLLIARAPHGLGQITLVAFDLDTQPFTTWGGQAEFWKKLQEKTRTKPIETAVATTYRQNSPQQDDELAAALERELENFQDIPVISFGWVALFILAYIVVVGPLDYLFLKKVVKRLELTWITFPTIVLVVSAAAYFTAYSLKGNDLKINKLDLVDIDLQSSRAFGNSWFTLFSPRIQLYTVGVEPTLGEASPRDQRPSVVVSWMGRPDNSYGGSQRVRSQSLFRRTYEYAPDATGLQGVPIQVWSTKSFTASWDRPFNPGQVPIQPNLHHRLPQSGLEGSITSRLPAPLEDAYLIYSEGRTDPKVYSLGTLFPGQAKRLNPATPAISLQQWTTHGPEQPANVLGGSLIKRIMFSAIPGQGQVRNSALQFLDQSWRRNLKNEAILVGRLTRAEGTAEAVNAAPESLCRLWLGQLPDSGQPRPALAGTLASDTYVRAFMTVQAPAAPDKGPAE
jgi:hypothetical protein